MLVGNTSENGYQSLFLQEESPEISSLLKEFPGNTNILVVDNNLINLLNMKEIMKRYAYQVTVYTDAKAALAFLSSCKHEINVVIWDFHMPGINGLQALEIIGSKLDLPVVIMSDENQVESVIRATIHGACEYVLKPVRKEVVANIWKHIVRKRMMSNPGLLQPVQLDPVQNDGLMQNIDIIDQDNQNIDMIEETSSKKQRMTLVGEMELDLSDLVFTYDLEEENNDFKIINQYNDENIDKKKEKKPRMKWTSDLEHKFLKAIDIIGGAEKASPNSILKCFEDMKVEGITTTQIASHLQKYRILLEESQIPKQNQEFGRFSVCRPQSFIGLNNFQTATSSLMNGRAISPIQQNQYESNGHLNMNNNRFMTNHLPSLPYFDDRYLEIQQQQQQQHHLSQQLNYVRSQKRPERSF